MMESAFASVRSWHGNALAGIQVSHFLEVAAAELEELRLAAVEERVAVTGATADVDCDQVENNGAEFVEVTRADAV